MFVTASFFRTWDTPHSTRKSNLGLIVVYCQTLKSRLTRSKSASRNEGCTPTCSLRSQSLGTVACLSDILPAECWPRLMDGMESRSAWTQRRDNDQRRRGRQGPVLRFQFANRMELLQM